MSTVTPIGDRRPPCPHCEQPATLVTVRKISEAVQQGSYACENGHVWLTKWFGEVSV